jgi:hypothetical protein
MIKNIKRLVVSSEELLRLKANNETLSAEECRNFVQTWKREHKDLLVSQLGSKNQCLGFVVFKEDSPSAAATLHGGCLPP